MRSFKCILAGHYLAVMVSPSTERAWPSWANGKNRASAISLSLSHTFSPFYPPFLDFYKDVKIPRATTTNAPIISRDAEIARGRSNLCRQHFSTGREKKKKKEERRGTDQPQDPLVTREKFLGRFRPNG